MPAIAENYFNCPDYEDLMVRRSKKNTKDKSKRRESCVIVVCEDKVIINEKKTNAKSEYVIDFIKMLDTFFDYFPEYKDKKLIPVFASLYISEDVVNLLSKNNIYAMAIKDNTMNLINYGNVVKSSRGLIEGYSGANDLMKSGTLLPVPFWSFRN